MNDKMLSASLDMIEARLFSDIAGAQPAGRPIPTDDDALLHEAEAAFLQAESIRTFQGRRIRGTGPRFIKIGRSVRYTRRLLREFNERHTRRSTSDPGQAAD